ncbi:MAG: baseplate J/gp47 family protein [Mycobacterium sp.]
MVAGLFQRLDVLARDQTPNTATAEGADRWGAALKVERKGPTPASSSSAAEFRGAPGSSVPISTAIAVSNSEITMHTTSAVVVPLAGVVRIPVQTDQVGETANLAAGTEIRFSVVPAGMEEVGQLALSLDNAIDTEPIGTFQGRVSDALANPAQGGNSADFKRWIEAALPALLVEGFPLEWRNGRGTVDVVALRLDRGPDRVVADADRDQMISYIAERKLTTDAVRAPSVVPVIVDVEVAIRPIEDPAFRFDFGDDGGREIAGWDPTTRTLTLGSAAPSGMAPGHRVSVRLPEGLSQGATGAEFLIATIPTDTTVVILDDPDNVLPTPFPPGARLFAGGALVETVRQAILNGYQIGCESDAPSVPGINQLGPANPDTRYGSWRAAIEPERLASAARVQAGVDQATTIAPSDVIVPLDPATPGPTLPDGSASIEVLVAGQVIVRRA